MNFALSLLPVLLAFPCLAQLQPVSVTAYSRSLSFNSVTANNGSVYNWEFTTADHRTGLPLFVPEPGGAVLVSNEVRPLAGEPGVYESDYVLLLNTLLTQYGTLNLTIPNLDTNRDGIPDLSDPALPMYRDVTGTGYSTWPSSNSFRVDLRMSRTAGATTGAFSGIWTPVGSSFLINGTLQLPLLQGTASYTRGRQNQLQLQLTRWRPDGSSTCLTGAVVYAANANWITLPRFGLTDTNGLNYTVLPAMLTRKGHTYQGRLKFVDGAPETPWADYTDWVMAINDPNDGNTNGVPDLSDPAAVVIPRGLLTVTTNGLGRVSPSLSGENLELEKSYRLTATPGVGYLFDGWDGDIVSDSRTLTFVMETNLSLTANFVPNPFYPVRGTYYGLIGDTNGPANQTLGVITASVTEGGAYSARIRLGGRSFSVSGSLDSTGTDMPAFAPADQPPLFLALHLDLQGNTGLSGTISNSTWTGCINANQATFNPASNPCAYAGKYTVVIPPEIKVMMNPSPDIGVVVGPSGPAGYGYGTVSVNAAGRLRFYGSLADGTHVTQSTVVSATADWPLYASLYSGQGCVSSWASLTNQTVTALSVTSGSNVLSWVKPASARAKYYPQGYTNQVALQLAPYAAPAPGGSVLAWTNGLALFTGGNLEQDFSPAISFGSHNKLATGTTDQLTLRLLANGLFQGRVTPPNASRSFSFRGALLQQAGLGLGFLLGADQSSDVELGPLPSPP
jgi:hypothetical protein